ncbi:MAG: two-component system histidine kinase PnpS [Candidatus Omnitrophota bacterium]
MRVNIQYKITFIISLIVAVILLGVFIYLQNHLKEQTYRAIKSDLKSKINLAASFLRNQYSGTLTTKNIDDIADHISNDLGLRVTIINRDGKVLGDSNLSLQGVESIDNHLQRPEVQQALRNGLGESQRYSETDSRDMIYLAVPFQDKTGNSPGGVLRLAVPLSSADQYSNSLIKLLFISLGIAFCLSLILGFFASYVVSSPIKEVSSLAKGIAAGDFSRSIDIHTDDEFGDLSNSINYMSKQIKERIDEVVSSRLRLEAVLLSMFDGVIVVDKNGKMKLMNKALRNLFQVMEEVVGKKPIEVIRNVEIQEIVNQVTQQEAGALSRELSVLFPHEKHFIIHATPVTLNGVIDGAVMVFHDITELRRLESVRKDFVANVSHELRTPITNIKGYAETLLEGALNDKANAEDFTKIIYSESERLAKLVEDVLDLSRIESGKMEFIFKEQNIKELVSRVEKGLGKQIENKRITFKNEIPDTIGDVTFDATSIAQVLLNLIENAIKYNKENGTVTVSAVSKGSGIEVSISDTGIGIPEDDLPRVFERFYRVDKAHSREIGGTGLGLSIVKHIIQAHKGEVYVTSKLGEGSTFRFTLPRH